MEKEKTYHKLAMIFFLAAIVIHAAGYFTNYFYILGWIIWIPALVLAFFAIRRILKDQYLINPYLNTRKVLLSSEFIGFCITFVYVIFNVIYTTLILKDGGAQYTEGTYFLINLGERIREITQEEYGRLLLAEYRMFSGHILLLYALTVLFFKTRLLEDEE